MMNKKWLVLTCHFLFSLNAIQPWRYKPRIYNWAYWASGGFLHFFFEWSGVVISAGTALLEVKSHDVVKVTIYPKDMFKTGRFPQTTLQIPFAPLSIRMNLQWCFPSAVSTICVALIGCVWKRELKKDGIFFIFLSKAMGDLLYRAFMDLTLWPLLSCT